LFSKVMPHIVAERFRKAASDPELLSLIRDTAVIDARMREVFGSLGKPGGSWNAVLRAKEAILRARRKRDMVALRNALNDVVAAIEASSGEVERWREVSDLIDSRRKLVGAIWKHQVRMTMPQIIALFNGLAMLVRKGFVELIAQLVEERDKQAARKVLADIVEGLESLAHLPVPPLTDPVQ
jgi:hypothetical protein